MQKRRPLSLSSQTFSDIRNSNAIYVDKTQYLYQLIDAYPVNKYFFSRPRRFGKSLTISTFKEIFAGKKELFQGLYIAEQTDYDFQKFPVLHFDFSKIAHGNREELESELRYQILTYATQQGVDLSAVSSVSGIWNRLISLFKEKGQKIVILIDEYDKPILDHITNLPIAKENRDVLKGFYEIIKANDEALRFVFITGITKFSQMNIFSGLNNLTDISMDPDYATLCGYTQDELESCFSAHLDAFSESEGMPKPALLNKIKTWYNGFRFTKSPITLYNPYSTLSMLKAKTFQYHWFVTGTPTYLMALLQTLAIDLENIPNQISINDTAAYNVDNFSVNFPALLFQTGYLTVRDYDVEYDVLTLDYPNLEVREAFTQEILKTLSHQENSTAVTIIDLRRALDRNQIPEVFRILKLFFAKIPYDIQLKQEKYYQSLFYLIFTVIGTRIRAEVRTHKGRIDALVETASHLYLFEFKLSPPYPPQRGERDFEGDRRKATLPFTPEEKDFSERASELTTPPVGHPSTEGNHLPGVVGMSGETANPYKKSSFPLEGAGGDINHSIARSALAQIDTKDYAFPFSDSTKTIIKIGVSFSTKERNITEWITSTHGPR